MYPGSSYMPSPLCLCCPVAISLLGLAVCVCFCGFVCVLRTSVTLSLLVYLSPFTLIMPERTVLTRRRKDILLVSSRKHTVRYLNPAYININHRSHDLDRSNFNTRARKYEMRKQQQLRRAGVRPFASTFRNEMKSRGVVSSRPKAATQ